MGESINLINEFKVDNVIFNIGDYNDLELELIKVLDDKNIKYYKGLKQLNINNNVIYFLNKELQDNENDNSSVIYAEINGTKILLMGDAGVNVEKEILNKYNLSNIDVLKVGHHGSKTSSSESFISKINPIYSIISVGKNNWYGHPNEEILEILKDTDVYRTDINGSIKFKIKNKLEIKTCIPQKGVNMNYYNEIKTNLINNEVYKKVKDYSKNRSDLNTYYNVGKLLFEAGKHYGEGIIKEYSIKLTNELGKGYTFTSLTRMKKNLLSYRKSCDNVATINIWSLC